MGDVSLRQRRDDGLIAAHPLVDRCWRAERQCALPLQPTNTRTEVTSRFAFVRSWNLRRDVVHTSAEVGHHSPVKRGEVRMARTTSMPRQRALVRSLAMYSMALSTGSAFRIRAGGLS